MKQILLVLIVGLALTACSKSLSFGKKCVEKDNNIVYSYVWLHNKGNLQANKDTCKLIEN